MIAAVFAGARDVSRSIVDMMISKHQEADVDKLGRGLKGYTAIDISSWDMDEVYNSKLEVERASAGIKGMKAAKYGSVAVLNGNDMMVGPSLGDAGGSLAEKRYSKNTDGIESFSWG
jgi:hypothetical protein